MYKRILGLLSLLVIAVVVVSCQFSENIYINDDGSGKMEFVFDGSQLMSMAGNEIKEEVGESLDTIMYFKDYLELKKDSISKLSAEEQAKLYAMKDFGMHMNINSEAQQMNFNLFTEFKNVNELSDMFSAMNKIKAMGDANPLSGTVSKSDATSLKYTYSGKLFTRKSKIENQELFNQQKDSVGEMAMMFESSTYTVNYHFPKRVKKVSNTSAVISDDKKTVTIEYGFMDFLKDPEILNVEIELEK